MHQLRRRNAPVFKAQAVVIKHNIGRVRRELRHLSPSSVDGKKQLERRAAEHVNLHLILGQQKLAVGAQAHVFECRAHGRIQPDGLLESGRGGYQRVDPLADQKILERLELRAVLGLGASAALGKRPDHFLCPAHAHARCCGQFKCVGEDVALEPLVQALAI